MSEFGRRTGVPIGPNVDQRAALLCVGATRRQKAFPQNFRFPLERACALICDDIERFGELMCVDVAADAIVLRMY